MILIGRQKLDTDISSYSNQLMYYLHFYLNKLEIKSKSYPEKALEKAKIYLRWIVYPNDKELQRDYKKIIDDMHSKTWNVIGQYTKCVMQLLGSIAEAVVVDRCSQNSNINMIFINIAKLKPNLYGEYDDISYDDYIAFSPSFKYVLVEDDDKI